NLTVGFFTSFLSYSMMFSKPFNELSANLTQIFSAKAGLDTIEVLLAQDEIEDKGTLEIESEEEVSFKDVSFSYVKYKLLIEGLNLNVKTIQKIAIVGPISSGKSTLINILMRYYHMDKGEGLIDDYLIEHIRRKNLHQNISIV